MVERIRPVTTESIRAHLTGGHYHSVPTEDVARAGPLDLDMLHQAAHKSANAFSTYAERTAAMNHYHARPDWGWDSPPISQDERAHSEQHLYDLFNDRRR